MTLTATELVANVSALTSFPDVAMKIDELVNDRDSSASDLGQVIRTDPALTAALLRIANSALYSSVGTVADIDNAITTVGFRPIRDLAFGISAVSCFDGIPNDLVSPEDFWKHSLYCAVAAQHIATTTRRCKNQSLFTAGLLHDIGQLVMYNQQPELSRQALEHSLQFDDGLSATLGEREVFGFDHTEVGFALAVAWQFPAVLLECLRDHHSPLSQPETPDAVLVVHLANSIAALVELESYDLEDVSPVEESVFEHLGLNIDSVPELVDTARANAADLMQIFVKS